MGIQTAPSTITVAVTGGNTIFSLIDLTDTMVTYRATTVAGVAVSDISKQPVMTMSRRQVSRANPNYKYVARCVHASFDALGAVVGRDTIQHEHVEGANYSQGVGALDTSQLEKAVNLAMNTTEFQAVLADKSWFR